MPRTRKFKSRPLQATHITQLIGFILKDLLGYYHFQNSQTSFAISVGRPLNNVSVEGLELVVDSAARSSDREATWSISLLDRESPESGTLGLAAELLRQSFKAGATIQYMPANAELDSMAQIRATMPYGALLNLRNRWKIQDLKEPDT